MTSLFGGFGTTAAPSSGALTVPVTDEIVQLSTPFSKLPANRQADLERIDAEFQKQSLVSAEIDRLLEEAERNEAFSMADISRLEQRLKLLQLQIKRTRNSLLGFREEMRRELKHGEQALFANARLKHKSIQQLWPQLPSRYFFDKMEEFRGRITKLMQDVEDIQHHLSANPSQQSPPQMLHALLSNTHNEVVALSCEVARVHSIVNQQKETFIDEKISKKADPFEVAPKRDESVVQQQQLLLLTAPPAAQPGAAPASTYPALGAPPGQQQSTGFGATTGPGTKNRTLSPCHHAVLAQPMAWGFAAMERQQAIVDSLWNLVAPRAANGTIGTMMLTTVTNLIALAPFLASLLPFSYAAVYAYAYTHNYASTVPANGNSNNANCTPFNTSRTGVLVALIVMASHAVITFVAKVLEPAINQMSNPASRTSVAKWIGVVGCMIITVFGGAALKSILNGSASGVEFLSGILYALPMAVISYSSNLASVQGKTSVGSGSLRATSALIAGISAAALAAYQGNDSAKQFVTGVLMGLADAGQFVPAIGQPMLGAPASPICTLHNAAP
ncbi:unnamed protein product (mitochondrion) [Plasmodiophora brassicae]|uniref:Uncharacterized protein n=1 Tax=Plasmodiophora brassicae TaxID=37360 RepID=A0A3P3Y1J8_PLABS|nr:unnamed protein product [Plasmodiophora brassicae]